MTNNTARNSKTIKNQIQQLKCMFPLFKEKSDNSIFNVLPVFYSYFYKSKNFDTLYIDNITDGANDNGIDFIIANPDTIANELIVVQGKNYNKTSLSFEDFAGNIDKTIDGIKNLIEGKTENYNSKVVDAYKKESEKLKSPFSVRIVFATAETLVNKNKERFESICAEKSENSGYSIDLLDGDDIVEKIKNTICETEFIDEANLTVLSPHVSEYNNIITFFGDCAEIKDLVIKHGDKLFDNNIRGLVKRSTSQCTDVDNGIRNTLLHHPDKMAAFNQGIKISATKGYKYDGKSVKIYGFSIINGCQTSWGLESFDKWDSMPCKAPIQVTITNTGSDQEFMNEISKCSNTQKPIKTADLHSQDECQKLIQNRMLNTFHVSYQRKTNANDKKKMINTEKLGGMNMSNFGKIGLSVILLDPGTANGSCGSSLKTPNYDLLFKPENCEHIIFGKLLKKRFSAIKDNFFRNDKIVSYYENPQKINDDNCTSRKKSKKKDIATEIVVKQKKSSLFTEEEYETARNYFSDWGFCDDMFAFRKCFGNSETTFLTLFAIMSAQVNNIFDIYSLPGFLKNKDFTESDICELWNNGSIYSDKLRENLDDSETFNALTELVNKIMYSVIKPAYEQCLRDKCKKNDRDAFRAKDYFCDLILPLFLKKYKKTKQYEGLEHLAIKIFKI